VEPISGYWNVASRRDGNGGCTVVDESSGSEYRENKLSREDRYGN